MSLYPRKSYASLGGMHASSSAGSTSSLRARIEEKQKEYESLVQLRTLSANLALQMEELEKKLELVADGTESVVSILANWQHVFKAINISNLSTRDHTEEDSAERPQEQDKLDCLVRVEADPQD